MKANSHLTSRAAIGRIVLVGSLLTAHIFAVPAQGRSDGLRQWMQTLANGGGVSVAGNWFGSKVENDPIHGGYITLSFRFSFSSDGTYQETAYMGNRQVMSASGAYQQSGSSLAFNPQRCEFASPELGQTVKFFPIPTDSSAQYLISFSPLEGGVQMSLKDTASGDQWGLKPQH